MSYVYLLYSQAADAYYLGYTKNIEQRIEEHNSGRGSGWTKKRGPWKLVYFETFPNDQDARKREIAIKKKKRRSYLEWLVDNGPGNSVR